MVSSTAPATLGGDPEPDTDPADTDPADTDLLSGDQYDADDRRVGFGDEDYDWV